MKRILIIGLIALAVLFLGRNWIVGAAINLGIRGVTGLSSSIRGIDAGLMRTTLEIKELTVYNPPGFPDKVMMRLPELYVDFDPIGFLKGRIHLEKVRLNLEEFVVVRNRQAQLNLDSIQVVKEGHKTGNRKELEKKESPLKVDLLELKVGKVIYKDYSGEAAAPRVQQFRINLNERYTNIQNPEVLVSLILVKALANTTIASLANFDIGMLQGIAGDSLKRATAIATETIDATRKATEKAAGTLRKLFPLENH
ncbi:MAG: hypothetical protein HY211_03390 [Candidatus Omnitrophica bacterium]|nr:hypothetical protein [Candidatus Omnitrophota bacterium]